MSQEKDPREWLRYAENDQRAAKALIEAGIYEHCVFHCQQAVEKLLKAIIVKQTGDRPPHIHDLRALLEWITVSVVPDDVARLISDVSGYYVGTRYPIGVVDSDAFERSRAEIAMRQMNEIFQWCSTNFSFIND